MRALEPPSRAAGQASRGDGPEAAAQNWAQKPHDAGLPAAPRFQVSLTPLCGNARSSHGRDHQGPAAPGAGSCQAASDAGLPPGGGSAPSVLPAVVCGTPSPPRPRRPGPPLPAGRRAERCRVTAAARQYGLPGRAGGAGGRRVGRA